MKSAYNKEIWRAIRKGKKRFFSIMLITILGVGMLTGLRAACMDLRYSADQFYDRQGLYDISVVSTLGLTEKDVDALKALDGVADAVGVYSETVHAKVNDHEVSIAVCTLNDRGINQPYVLSGRLPESADETAVTTAFADETGCGIGDVIAVDIDNLVPQFCRIVDRMDALQLQQRHLLGKAHSFQCHRLLSLGIEINRFDVQKHLRVITPGIQLHFSLYSVGGHDFSRFDILFSHTLLLSFSINRQCGMPFIKFLFPREPSAD